MIRTVQCSSCSTSFPVDTRKVPEEGVYARCSNCSSVFFVDAGEPATAFAGAAQAGAGGGLEPSSTAIDSGSSATPTVDTGSAEPDAWVLEREPEVDSSAIEVERLDTIEEDLRQQQPQFSAPAAPVAPPIPVREPEPVRAAPPPPVAATPARPSGFTFGRRDPHEKASRLARVLVSDIITYNPERHQRALDGGTLKPDFDDEIKKSWGEYVDQVGKELAESTDYFKKALNEILARGQQVF